MPTTRAFEGDDDGGRSADQASREVDRRDGRLWTFWDRKYPPPLLHFPLRVFPYNIEYVLIVADTKQYSLQFFYKTEREERYAGVPGLAPGQ